jgi:lipopolysaccharide/colanic/teichoic acid biosynthesis glycosyltransferase
MIFKRAFDILFSFLGILLVLPVFLILAFWIVIESKGGVFYRQNRVGKNNKDFKLLKFRTMYPDSDKKGLLTVGERDNRITKSGYILRKYKLDELPQLINVLRGDMSIVGPRPEVRKYVNLYTNEQLNVLKVKPGITDIASIKYAEESSLLEEFDDPEKAYIEKIMPDKLTENLVYAKRKPSVLYDMKIIFMTLRRIIAFR